jgi:hypothetical protein
MPERSRVAHWLLERDLSGFDAKGRAPATEAKREMRLATMGEAEAYLAELAAQGHPAFAGDLAAVEHMHALLPPLLANRTRGHVVARFLREEMGAIQLDGRSRLADGKMRVRYRRVRPIKAGNASGLALRQGHCAKLYIC